MDGKETNLLFDKASSLYKEKQYDQALKSLGLIKEKDAAFYLLRAQIFYALNEFYLSNEDIKKGITLHPDNIQLYNLSALNYIAMFNIDKAKEVISNYEAKNGKKESFADISKQIEDKEKEIESNIKKYKSYPKFLRFIRYLYDKGAYVNKIDIVLTDETNRSVITTGQILKKENILRIPYEALITLELAQESEIGKNITSTVKKQLKSPNHCVFTTYLLSEMEKGESSKWKFYLDMLPESYDNFPVFYKEKEEQLLKGTSFLQIVNSKKKEIYQDYVTLCGVINNFQRFSYDNFCKVRMIVSSRIFGVKIKNLKTEVFAPYADMLNHRRVRQTHWNYEDSYNAFVISAIENIEPGYELYDSYGKKCNSRFLLNYGFTLENNEDNEYKLSITLAENSYKYKEKSAILKNSITKKFTLRKDLEDTQATLLFSFLRFVCFDGDTNLYKDYKAENVLNPISMNNEIMMLKKLQESIEFLLRDYDTSLEDDVTLLATKKSTLSFNEMNCITMRISEKEILRFYSDLAKYCIALFSKERTAIEAMMKEENQDKQLLIYSSYIKEVIKHLFK